MNVQTRLGPLTVHPYESALGSIYLDPTPPNSPPLLVVLPWSNRPVEYSPGFTDGESGVYKTVWVSGGEGFGPYVPPFVWASIGTTDVVFMCGLRRQRGRDKGHLPHRRQAAGNDASCDAGVRTWRFG